MEKACELYEEARMLGCADAAMKLGLLSELEDDMVQAQRFYEEAHVGGSMDGTYMLGRLHEDQGNIKNARELYQKASAHGHADAEHHLSLLDRGPNAQMSALRDKMAQPALQVKTSQDAGVGLDIGVRVQVQGLTSSEGKRLNNCMGTIVKHDPSSERFGVEVDGFKGIKSIKAEHLVRAMRRFPEQPHIEVASLDTDEVSAQQALWRSSNDAHTSVTSMQTESGINAQVSSAILESRASEAEL